MRVKLSENAEKDLENFIDYYLQEAGDTTVLHLLKQLQQFLFKIEDFPKIGSIYVCQKEEKQKSFRILKISKFPLVIVYRINLKMRNVEVSRIFHTSRNIANRSI